MSCFGFYLHTLDSGLRSMIHLLLVARIPIYKSFDVLGKKNRMVLSDLFLETT